jgi:hypothetical protein
MIGTNVTSCKPNWGKGLVTCLSQVVENGKDVSRADKTGNVFEEDGAGLALSNNSNCLGPHIALIIFSQLLASGRERLARESGAEAPHSSAPGHSIECSHVIPDGGIVQVPVSDALLEDFDAVVIPLDVADGPEPEQVRCGKQAPSCS